MGSGALELSGVGFRAQGLWLRGSAWEFKGG